jgi:hypothetical protein
MAGAGWATPAFGCEEKPWQLRLDALVRRVFGWVRFGYDMELTRWDIETRSCYFVLESLFVGLHRN